MTDDSMNRFEQDHLKRWWEATCYYLFADMENLPGAAAEAKDGWLPPQTDSHGGRKRFIARARGQILRSVRRGEQGDSLRELESTFQQQIAFIARHPDVPRRLLSWLAQDDDRGLQRRVRMLIGHYALVWPESSPAPKNRASSGPTCNQVPQQFRLSVSSRDWCLEPLLRRSGESGSYGKRPRLSPFTGPHWLFLRNESRREFSRGWKKREDIHAKKRIPYLGNFPGRCRLRLADHQGRRRDPVRWRSGASLCRKLRAVRALVQLSGWLRIRHRWRWTVAAASLGGVAGRRHRRSDCVCLCGIRRARLCRRGL